MSQDPIIQIWLWRNIADIIESAAAWPSAAFPAEDAPRSGRPTQIDEIEVVAATLAGNGRPPERLGITHWSARLMAAAGRC